MKWFLVLAIYVSDHDSNNHHHFKYTFLGQTMTLRSCEILKRQEEDVYKFDADTYVECRPSSDFEHVKKEKK